MWECVSIFWRTFRSEMNQKAWEFYKQITQGLVCENIKKKHIVSHSLTMYELTKACE